MIQRDYIVRMTELLARALTKILMLKEQSQFDKALDEIDLAGKELLGNDFQVLKHLSDTDLIKWMYSDGNFDSSKCNSMTQLLKAEGEILEAKGLFQQSRIRYLQALHLLTEAAMQNENQHNEETRNMLAWLTDKAINERMN